MNWIFDHFQIVILIALGIGSVVKSMLESKAKQNQEREEEYDPGEVFAPDEEYQPPVMPPTPPPLTRQVVPHSQRLGGYDEAVAAETARELKHQRDLAEHLRQIRETRATTTGGAAATRARVSAKGAKKSMAKIPLSIRGRLRDPQEVRRAFVMREILDPPVGLR
ncbi:MAG: hypothetical protein RLZZ214_2623 [Verrucomicrobiota bacterium]|jgi:hypothetical protein